MGVNSLVFELSVIFCVQFLIGVSMMGLGEEGFGGGRAPDNDFACSFIKLHEGVGGGGVRGGEGPRLSFYWEQ